MSDLVRNCSDCSAPMERGFIMDKSYGATLISRWVQGAPEKGWQGAKTRNRDCREVETWRCVRCGLLKSYAIEEAEPPSLFNP